MGLNTLVLLSVILIILSGFINGDITKSLDACSTRLCHCKTSYADCSHRRLTYIPKLPDRICNLHLNGNHIKTISAGISQNISTFNISTLLFKNAGIQEIHEDTFSHFPNLEHLDLSYNKLNEKSLFNLTSTLKPLKRLMYLGLINTTIEKTIPIGLFQNMAESRLHQIDLSENKIEFLNMTELKPMTRLVSLRVLNNKIKTVFMDDLKDLREIILTGNKLTDIPNFCDEHVVPPPKLSKLLIDENLISKIVPENLECLQHLLIVNFNKNLITRVSANTFRNFRSLVSIYLCAQRGSGISVEDYAFNNSIIRKIDLSSNSAEIRHYGINAFSGLTNVKFLQMSANSLSDTHRRTCNRLSTILEPLVSLETLLFNSVGLKHIPDSLRYMKHLRRVVLTHNQIESWPHEFWDHTKLDSLDVTYNSIITVSKAMIGEPVRSRMKRLSIGYNPLQCKCELVWFIKWIHRNRSIFDGYPHGYRCLNLTEAACIHDKLFTQIITSVCFILTAMLTIISILYKYRWTIKYQIYIWRHKKTRTLLIEDGHFDYDVFVSYCADDGDWVVDKLIPHIEGEEHIKLCIHERDFLGGKLILDNIIECLQSSRRVLIILSNNFARSQWCQFELMLSQDRVLNNNLSPPTVVLLEDIETENMSATLHSLIKNTTYITWAENDDNSVEFWQRLKGSLNTN